MYTSVLHAAEFSIMFICVVLELVESHTSKESSVTEFFPIIEVFQKHGKMGSHNNTTQNMEALSNHGASFSNS